MLPFIDMKIHDNVIETYQVGKSNSTEFSFVSHKTLNPQLCDYLSGYAVKKLNLLYKKYFK